MSIDIATVTSSNRNGTHPGTALSDEEILCSHRSQALFRESPERALAADGLFSIETAPDMDRSSAIVALATDSPDRFLDLVSSLSPIIQDILIQYYLLGRTYAQIGLTLFPRRSQNAAQILVKTGNRLGLRALAAFARAPQCAEWREMLAFQRKRTATIRLRSPHDLGDFVIAPNGQLGELFAPSWSMMNPGRLRRAGDQ